MEQESNFLFEKTGINKLRGFSLILQTTKVIPRNRPLLVTYIKTKVCAIPMTVHYLNTEYISADKEKTLLKQSISQQIRRRHYLNTAYFSR